METHRKLLRWSRSRSKVTNIWDEKKKELEVPFYSSCSYPDGMPYVERKQQIWGIEGLKARKTKCIQRKKSLVKIDQES